jgi:hypothetical protein
MSWLAASLYLSDGRMVRIGHDEAETENQPESFSFDTSNPGGFGSASIQLPRPENLYADDAKLFSHVIVYGEAGTVYEGMVVGVPQVGANSINLQLAGWVTALDRHETFREIYVDRDLGSWSDPSNSRYQALLAAYESVAGPSVESDTANALPALKLDVDGILTDPAREAWYDAGAGCEVAAVYYDMTSLSLATYGGYVGVASDDVATASELTADLLTGTNSSAAGTFTATTPYRYGILLFTFLGTQTGTATSMTFRNLAVYGNHGLTLSGTAPGGFLASDVVAHMIDQCPSLTRDADSIETTTFAIPHLTFKDDTSLRAAVEQVTALGGNANVPNDWGVYEGRQFYWRSPGTYGRVWHVRRDQVATSSSDGPDADRRVAGVKINYTDASGTPLSVGPIGSNADYETDDLIDSDPDNPAHRIPGAFKSESVGITSQQGAINIGVLILNERNRLDWRGSVEIQGEAQDANGNTYPSYLIRAGDRIVISDSDNPTERTIVSTSYDHDSMTTSAAIGAAPDSLESLLGQLAAVTDLVTT